ncbi:MAG: glycosyltransferase [Clostridiales bacterium]|nr:glycosyltransferase [Clostridiales bacterium]
MQVAIVHDWLTNMGGAEKVVESLMDIYPNAPIYTSMVNMSNISEKFHGREIITSFLQNRVRGNKVNHQKYLAFMPAAFESFDLSGYDVVLSSSSSCAKGVVTSPGALHVCYCHTPMRYGWEFYCDYIKEFGKLKKMLVKYFMSYMRMWDLASSSRVDCFIANSENVALRIGKHYRRGAEVIHPPVNTDYFTADGSPKADYFLCVSRLVPYKRIDIAVKAFSELGLPLVVIGGGSELEPLRSIAGPNIAFLGRQPDGAVREHYRKCRAFVFPGEEDFGIAPVEAQACGSPVIAFGGGGALETVIGGRTGMFFGEQTAESLIEAVRKFDSMSFDGRACRENAERFSAPLFEKRISGFIHRKYDDFIGGRRGFDA